MASLREFLGFGHFGLDHFGGKSKVGSFLGRATQEVRHLSAPFSGRSRGVAFMPEKLPSTGETRSQRGSDEKRFSSLPACVAQNILVLRAGLVNCSPRG